MGLLGRFEKLKHIPFSIFGFWSHAKIYYFKIKYNLEFGIWIAGCGWFRSRLEMRRAGS